MAKAKPPNNGTHRPNPDVVMYRKKYQSKPQKSKKPMIDWREKLASIRAELKQEGEILLGTEGLTDGSNLSDEPQNPPTAEISTISKTERDNELKCRKELVDSIKGKWRTIDQIWSELGQQIEQLGYTCRKCQE